MKKFDFSKCKSNEDIVKAIEETLKYDTIVDDDKAAEEYFRDCGIEGEVTHRLIVDAVVSFYDEEANGEEVYLAMVWKHYVDSGSNDYVYSYAIAIP